MEINILNKTDSVANNFMRDVRDKNIQKDRMRFRRNLERVGEVMAYEFSKTLNYEEQVVETPFGKSKLSLPTNDLVVISIMRAGIPFHQGFLNYFDDIDSGFIGAYRDKSGDIDNVLINLDYFKSPHLEDKEVIILDPMLATGKSLNRAIASILANGKPMKIHIISMLSSVMGLANVQSSNSFHGSIWIYALDDKLDENSYIIPGLGDAGDLAYGEKM